MFFFNIIIFTRCPKKYKTDLNSQKCLRWASAPGWQMCGRVPWNSSLWAGCNNQNNHTWVAFRKSWAGCVCRMRGEEGSISGSTPSSGSQGSSLPWELIRALAVGITLCTTWTVSPVSGSGTWLLSSWRGQQLCSSHVHTPSQGRLAQSWRSCEMKWMRPSRAVPTEYGATFGSHQGKCLYSTD